MRSPIRSRVFRHYPPCLHLRNHPLGLLRESCRGTDALPQFRGIQHARIAHGVLEFEHCGYPVAAKAQGDAHFALPRLARHVYPITSVSSFRRNPLVGLLPVLLVNITVLPYFLLPY